MEINVESTSRPRGKPIINWEGSIKCIRIAKNRDYENISESNSVLGENTSIDRYCGTVVTHLKLLTNLSDESVKSFTLLLFSCSSDMQYVKQEKGTQQSDESIPLIASEY